MTDTYVVNALVAVGLVFFSFTLSGISRPQHPREGPFFLLVAAAWLCNVCYLGLVYLGSRTGFGQEQAWVFVRILNNISFSSFLLAATVEAEGPAGWRALRFAAVAGLVASTTPLAVLTFPQAKGPVAVLSALFGMLSLTKLGLAFGSYFRSRRQPYPSAAKYLIVASTYLYGALQAGAIGELYLGQGIDLALFRLGAVFKLALLIGLGVFARSVLVRFEEGQHATNQARLALNTIAQMKHEMSGPATELRLALAGIEAGLAADHARPPDEALRQLESCLDEMRVPLERLVGIIASYPEYVRDAYFSDARPLERCNLNSVCEEVIINIKLTLKPRVRIEKDFRGGPTVDARRQQLFQIIRNLLKNGIEATESLAGGQVRIGTRRDTRPDREELSVVFVADNGPGIPDHLREKVFEDGFTTKKGSGGQGHGLFVARTLARGLGGDVTVVDNASAGLSGAVLEMALPFAPATTGNAKKGNDRGD